MWTMGRYRSRHQLKVIGVYILLLTASIPGISGQTGFVSPTTIPQTFPAATSSFGPSQTSFVNSQEFVNSHAFSNAQIAPQQSFTSVPQTFHSPQTFAGPVPQTFNTQTHMLHAPPQTFSSPSHMAYPPQTLPVPTSYYPPPIDHHAAKGFIPTSNMGGYFPPYPVNGQYWMGHTMPQYHPVHGYNQQALYQPYGQQWSYPGQYAQSGYQQYGYHPMSGYSSNFGHYPQFDAGYWTGHNMHHSQQVYWHPNTMYMQPKYYAGHPAMYRGHYVPAPYYPHPRDRGFLGGTGSGLAKGLLGALLVGVVAGSVAKKG